MDQNNTDSPNQAVMPSDPSVTDSTSKIMPDLGTEFEPHDLTSSENITEKDVAPNPINITPAADLGIDSSVASVEPDDSTKITLTSIDNQKDNTDSQVVETEPKADMPSEENLPMTDLPDDPDGNSSNPTSEIEQPSQTSSDNDPLDSSEPELEPESSMPNPSPESPANDDEASSHSNASEETSTEADTPTLNEKSNSVDTLATAEVDNPVEAHAADQELPDNIDSSTKEAPKPESSIISGGVVNPTPASIITPEIIAPESSAPEVEAESSVLGNPTNNQSNEDDSQSESNATASTTESALPASDSAESTDIDSTTEKAEPETPNEQNSADLKAPIVIANEAPVYKSPASESMPAATPLEQVAEKPPKDKKTRFKPLIIAVAAVIILGGGSAAAYVGIIAPNTPSNIFKKGLANFVVDLQSKQINENTNANFDIKNYDLSVDSTGSADLSHAAFNFTISPNFASIPFIAALKIDLQARIIDGNLYLSPGDLSSAFKLAEDYQPDVSSYLSTAESQFSNKWIEITNSELNSLSPGSQCLLNPSTYSISQSDVTAIENAYTQNPFLNVVSSKGSDVNNQSSEEYVINTNNSESKNFASSLKSLSIYKNLNNSCGNTSSMASTATKSKLKSTNFDLWINKSTKQLDQISFDTAGTKNNVTTDLTYSDNSTVSVPSASSVLSLTQAEAYFKQDEAAVQGQLNQDYNDGSSSSQSLLQQVEQNFGGSITSATQTN